MIASKIAIIVDPYSSGALYASKFAEYKVSCIAVQSSHTPPAHFVHDFIPLGFIQVLSPNHEEQDYIEELLSQLSTLNIVAVVAGCDTGVILTDQLSERLHLSGNDPSNVDDPALQGSNA